MEGSAHVQPPDVGAIVAALRLAPVAWHGRVQTVGEWVDTCKRDIHRWREQDSEVAVFQRFLAALLERQMSGETYQPRVSLFRERLSSPEELTTARAEETLRSLRYRFPSAGAEVMVRFRDLWYELGWSWADYFALAEEHWETGFLDDPLLGVRGIGLKTRDFALSEYSDYFCAFDVHISRLMARTGLVWWSPVWQAEARALGCDRPWNDHWYHSLRNLVVRFCRADGFPARPGCLTPADFDRTLWFFGQGLCGATTPCAQCPAVGVCLTGRQHVSSSDGTSSDCC